MISVFILVTQSLKLLAWCISLFQVNFGHVMIPDTFQPPAEHNLGQMLGFSEPLHGVTADAVYVVDSQSLRIENLNYDGLAPGKNRALMLSKTPHTKTYCIVLIACSFDSNVKSVIEWLLLYV